MKEQQIKDLAGNVYVESFCTTSTDGMPAVSTFKLESRIAELEGENAALRAKLAAARDFDWADRQLPTGQQGPVQRRVRRFGEQNR